jgi:putative methionine-R-sulfoxide reductase with GAF domain
MLLTVAIACLALNLLRRKDELDRQRLSRLRAVSVLTHHLNRLCTLRDLGDGLADVLPLLAAAVGGGERPIQIRMVFRSAKHIAHLRREARLAPGAPCPAAATRKSVANHADDAGMECHAEISSASRLCVPVSISDGEIFGVITLFSPDPAPYSEEEQRFIRFVSRSISLCAHRLRQMEELQRTVEMASCVTAAHIASADSVQHTMESVVEGVLSLVSADQATIFLWNEKKERLEAAFTRGDRAMDERELVFSRGEGIVGKAFEAGETCQTLNVHDERAYRDRFSAIKSLLAVPIQTIKGEMVGVLTVSRLTSKEEFSEDEMALAATFAHRSSHALRAAQYHEKMGDHDGSHSQAA